MTHKKYSKYREQNFIVFKASGLPQLQSRVTVSWLKKCSIHCVTVANPALGVLGKVRFSWSARTIFGLKQWVIISEKGCHKQCKLSHKKFLRGLSTSCTSKLFYDFIVKNLSQLSFPWDDVWAWCHWQHQLCLLLDMIYDCNIKFMCIMLLWSGQ